MSQNEIALNETVTTADERTAAAKIGSFLQKQGALVILLLLCLFAAISYENFLTPENLTNVLRQNSFVGLVALGMTFVILTGGIDLSVGSILALAGVVAAFLAPYGLIPAIIGAVVTGILLGLINGMIIAKGRIQPFIVTLAMMIAVRGLVLAITDEKSVRIGIPADNLTWFGQTVLSLQNTLPAGVIDSLMRFGDTVFSISKMLPFSTIEHLNWLGRGLIGGFLPVPILILLVCFAAGWLILNYTRFGRYVFALGDNDEAARLLGLNINRTTIGVYAISGALAGLAGLLLAARLGSGNPVEGAGIELSAIAAVVVGGTLLTGGQGSVISTLVGVLLLGVIFNLFNLGGQISPWWQLVLRGAILLAVVIIQNRLTKLK